MPDHIYLSEVDAGGPLAGMTLGDLGLVLQRQAGEQFSRKKTDPNKPKGTHEKDEPPDKNDTWWAEVGEYELDQSGDPAPKDEKDELLVAYLKESDHDITSLVKATKFNFRLRYFPGEGRTTKRLKKLGYATPDMQNGEGKDCANYFYTFAQAFKPTAKLRKGGTIRGQECTAGKGDNEFTYEPGQWNVDSRSLESNGWEYAGSLRGGGGGRNTDKPILRNPLKRAYARLQDSVIPSGASYWGGCSIGKPAGDKESNKVYEQLTKVSIDVEYETYVILCCSNQDAAPDQKPPEPGASNEDIEKDMKNIVPVAVVGYYAWEWSYELERDNNRTHAWSWSRKYPFSKWKWRGGERWKFGPGWKAIRDVSNEVFRDVKQIE